MNKHAFLKQNNRGASLIMVILCLVFIMALGAVAVNAAVKNVEMKSTDRKSKANYYLAEAALDEIKTGLSEDAAICMEAAYRVLLANYSANNTAMQRKLFREQFVTGMRAALGVNAGSDQVPLANLNSYLKETKPVLNTGAQVIGTPVIDTTAPDELLTIKGIQIKYRSDRYSNRISTDIRIKLPQSGMPSAYILPGLKDFVLIGDTALNIRFTDSFVNGNIYAGSNGINAGLGKTLHITGSSVITKGSIAVKDYGALYIDGLNTQVWADNLITAQTDRISDTANQTYLYINGSSYIKDDLVIAAKNSHVAMTGQYYGYSDGINSGDSSAIIINAINADLDLSGLNKLYLAGRAYISLKDGEGVPDYDSDESYGAGADANCDILTGESLVLKGSQNAYLLPAEYIKAGHNPVSWEEYTAAYDTVTKTDHCISIPEDTAAFELLSIPEEQRKLFYYLDEFNPVKKVFYKFGTNDNAVYYYLNFKSQKLATVYFYNFMKCYPDRVYNGFPVKRIKLNTAPGTFITAGNMITYASDFELIHGTNGNFINNYAREFTNLTTVLQKNPKGNGNTNPAQDIVFEEIVDINRLQQDASVYSDRKLLEKEAVLNGETYYACIIDNEATGTFNFNLSGKKGIIIATGDVNVNRNFEGLILSNGTIEFNASDISADPLLISSILTNDAQIRKYLKNAASESADDTIDIAGLIEFENWKKN